MASQFQQVMGVLEKIYRDIKKIESMVQEIRVTVTREGYGTSTDILEDVLFPEEETRYVDNEKSGEGSTASTAESPRTVLNYRTNDGKLGVVEYNDLDPQIKKVLEVARMYDDPWELYEDQMGNIRLMVSNEVLARYHKMTTPQPEPPRE